MLLDYRGVSYNNPIQDDRKPQLYSCAHAIAIKEDEGGISSKENERNTQPTCGYKRVSRDHPRLTI